MKVIDIFIVYVMDVDDGMLGIVDNDEVLIFYQDVICNNIMRILSFFLMKYFF